jgi:hypothetical protein
VQRASEEHPEILELCRQRDVAGAYRLLRQHIQHAGRSLKEIVAQRRDGRQNLELDEAWLVSSLLRLRCSRIRHLKNSGLRAVR